MHALIVVAHPNPTSLTHAVARQVGEGLACAGHTFELADLAAEGFDPRFTANDVAAHLRQAPQTADVLAEQARVDRADALVLVYPVYWWSFPALLKGWIDRVFANGWAYSETPEAGLRKRLGRLEAHLIGVAGADLGTYARHGYRRAMQTQIDHGIFDYCGARVITSELLAEGESGWAAQLDAARGLGCRVFAQACSAA